MTFLSRPTPPCLEILQDIFTAQRDSEAVGAPTYRADHADLIPTLDFIEQNHALAREGNRYRVTLAGTTLLPTELTDALFRKCASLFSLLRQHYKSAQQCGQQKRVVEERGFRATIENPAHGGRSVGVVLRKDKLVVGCEISITTGVEHETENLKKRQELGLTRILFISPDKRRRSRLARAIPALGLRTPVDVLAPDDLVVGLDQLGVPEAPTESKVRGNTVKVTRRSLSPEDFAGRRAAIAQLIARSLGKSRGV